jgi:protoporphyrin/coproporphyrin ferrochelatase
MFDAVLLVSFGGPQGLDDIRPFLQNVLRGRRVPPERIEAVAHHYELFGGVSPLTDLTMRQAERLRERLAVRGLPLPVYVGMRNWHPFLRDTLAEMAAGGIRQAVGVILAAHRSYSSCEQYRRNVDDARAELRRKGLPPLTVAYVADWHEHQGFIQAVAERVEEALGRLPAGARAAARVIFTAHSIPLAMAESGPYREQLDRSCRLAAARLGTTNWALVYQSRSGRPEDPWLEPDVCDYLRAERARGLEAAVLCPIGFVADHIEVLYDLDREAAGVCQEIGLPMARAGAVNDHPLFIEALEEAVEETIRRYGGGRALSVVSR